MKQMAAVLPEEQIQRTEGFKEFKNAITVINPTGETTTRLPFAPTDRQEMRHLQETNHRKSDELRAAARIPLEERLKDERGY